MDEESRQILHRIVEVAGDGGALGGSFHPLMAVLQESVHSADDVERVARLATSTQVGRLVAMYLVEALTVHLCGLRPPSYRREGVRRVWAVLGASHLGQHPEVAAALGSALASSEDNDDPDELATCLRLLGFVTRNQATLDSFRLDVARMAVRLGLFTAASRLLLRPLLMCEPHPMTPPYYPTASYGYSGTPAPPTPPWETTSQLAPASALLPFSQLVGLSRGPVAMSSVRILLIEALIGHERYLEAANMAVELAHHRDTAPEDAALLLRQAADCAVLVSPSENRAAVLSALLKEPALAVRRGLLEHAAAGFLLSAHEMAEFAAMLQIRIYGPPQTVAEPELARPVAAELLLRSTPLLEPAEVADRVRALLLEHNLVAVSRLYRRVTLPRLAELVGAHSTEAVEESLSALVVSAVLPCTRIDQVDAIVDFQSPVAAALPSAPRRLDVDSQLEEACSLADLIARKILSWGNAE